MAHSGKIKELYRFAVSTLYGGYLGIYMLSLAYMPMSCKCPSLRALRHIYPLHEGYLQRAVSLSACPDELIFGTGRAGIADFHG
jgi:hypothetical protein